MSFHHLLVLPTTPNTLNDRLLGAFEYFRTSSSSSLLDIRAFAMLLYLSRYHVFSASDSFFTSRVR